MPKNVSKKVGQSIFWSYQHNCSQVLDTCPGGEYAGFSHTYVIEDNVVEGDDGKMVEKVPVGETDTLTHCATVEERKRFETITFSLFMQLSLLSGFGLRVLTSQPGVCMLEPMSHLYTLAYFYQIGMFWSQR